MFEFTDRNWFANLPFGRNNKTHPKAVFYLD